MVKWSNIQFCVTAEGLEYFDDVFFKVCVLSALDDLRCANGYFGRPNVPGGFCQPCMCNGNLDRTAALSCDPETGGCRHCREGYGGQDCGRCADGYFGDALVAKNCQGE